MQAEVQSAEDLLLVELAEQMNGAMHEPAARAAYRAAFNRLRSHLNLYPSSDCSPSEVFESVARTARQLAANCLPLGLAVAMHLYPLCALQCVPMPRLSPARFKRALLLKSIRDRSMIVANVGGERTRATDEPLIATRTEDGIRIDGTCEYMSLGSVADLVFFRADLADGDGTVLCAADLKSESVRLGPWKFSGRMRLSDTSSVTFIDHPVPDGRYVVAPSNAGLQGISDYQRCWFHLIIAEVYLARIERLHREWRLPRSTDHIVSLHDIACLRDLSLRMLDVFEADASVEPLMRTTSLLKLRVSRLAQATATELRGRSTEDTGRPEADAAELGYLRMQPTADEKILRSLEGR